MSNMTLTAEKPKRKRGEGLGYSEKKLIWKGVRIAILSIFVIFAFFPAVWVLYSSFNPSQSMY